MSTIFLESVTSVWYSARKKPYSRDFTVHTWHRTTRFKVRHVSDTAGHKHMKWVQRSTRQRGESPEARREGGDGARSLWASGGTCSVSVHGCSESGATRRASVSTTGKKEGS